MAGTLAASAFATAPANATTTVTTVIGGLNAPRGIAFDGRGSLYVAESGVAGSGSAGLTNSGRVSRYRWGSWSTPKWSTSFESVFVTEDPTAPPDVLGPEGLSAVGDCGRHDDGHNPCQVMLIMSESHDGIAAATQGAVSTQQMGHLYLISGATGKATDKADVGDQMYAWTGDHSSLFPDDFPDSNPYGVLVTRSHDRFRTFVADAGANTISEVMRNGKTRVIAYIPNETVAPFRDATPTCIAQGPDGMLYVATLHLVANFMDPNQGLSDVWRVNPNASFPTKPKLWATGLTTATACTFDHRGNFWATEMFKNNASGPPGDLVRIPFKHPNRITHIGGGQLPLPGGIAQGPDGAMYVTVSSAGAPGTGAVVRVARD